MTKENITANTVSTWHVHVFTSALLHEQTHCAVHLASSGSIRHIWVVVNQWLRTTHPVRLRQTWRLNNVSAWR